MDIITKAIALRTTDYGESDKFILLYSLEHGKISVHARGVRKSSAKLKFATDQFCFGHYELAETKGYYTLKTCQQLESFFALREDVVCYYSANCIAEALIKLTAEGQSDSALFVEVLRALQNLCDNVDPLLVTLRFLLGFLQSAGFKLDFSQCSVCGKKQQPLFLDVQHGGVVCDTCCSEMAVSISPRVVSACTMVASIGYDKLKNIKLSKEICKEALNLVSRYISHSFVPLNSLAELAKLA